MRKMLGLAAAAALALGVSVASADEAKGPIMKIDMTNNTFEVEGKMFTASPENTTGVSLADLKEGDEVKVMYADPQSESGKPINAMALEKAE